MIFLFHFHISCSSFYSLSKSLMFLCSIFFSVLSPKWSHPLAVWSSCLNADHLQIYIYPYVFISNTHFKNTPLQIILAGLSAPNPCTVNTELPSSSSVLLYLSLLLLTQLYNFIWVPSLRFVLSSSSAFFCHSSKMWRNPIYHSVHSRSDLSYLLSSEVDSSLFWNLLCDRSSLFFSFLHAAHGFPRCCVWNNQLSLELPFWIPSLADQTALTLHV